MDQVLEGAAAGAALGASPRVDSADLFALANDNWAEGRKIAWFCMIRPVLMRSKRRFAPACAPVMYLERPALSE
ncbi:MAG: hypothetical protein BWX48_02241 [Verrucomicrobia bacterium ADurb.Bin006]|jgi:kynureninase|nr:MAG: hypothetical protein BWX48_02241 [Verrucomicrobia bacterium ADurb.Bin006]